MKIYEGTCLIMDGRPDGQGDIFSPDTVVELADNIPVTFGFSHKLEGVVGYAKLHREDDEIKYTIEIKDESPIEGTSLGWIPCVGGMITEKVDKTIKKCKLTSIGLALTNVDTRIQPLGVEDGNGT